MRTIRFGAADPCGSIALEPLYVEPKERGACRAALMTRRDRIYRGEAQVTATNAFITLQWSDPGRPESLSVRAVTLRRPARSRPDVYGGLLQRSKSTNSDPSSCVIAALRLSAFVRHPEILSQATAMLHGLSGGNCATAQSHAQSILRKIMEK
jgi:hypothetical protein